jgi:hypothetical protein
MGEDTMKTGISVPSRIFEPAQQLAKELDWLHSKLYTAALAAYTATYENADIARGGGTDA